MTLLTIQLIPKPLWGKNPIPREIWERLKIRKLLTHPNCRFCGNPANTIDATRSYNLKTQTCFIAGAITICANCYNIRHCGVQTGLIANEHVAHCLIHRNSWTLEDAIIHQEQAFMRYRRRSQILWKVRISPDFSNHLKLYTF